jgi:hypothetical protein
MDDKKFRTTSHTQTDYAEYEKIRDEVSADLGTKLSMAQVIRLAMTFYRQRRKSEEKKENVASAN